MKTIKIFQIAAVALALSVITVIVGCSDQLTGPLASGRESNSKSEEMLALNSFHKQIKLKPNESYSFNVANTKLKKITSVDIRTGWSSKDFDVLALNCQDIAIYSSSRANLSCQSKSIDVREITVENVGSEDLALDVNLIGIYANNSAHTQY